ncbi:hypothetical protein L596_013645 [Steinernema carpocapsae]|uniref:F-box domain-containing protein n=1 Tax=Steinernema carpocapsae TaxID=34508 RepID=A0A4U5P0X7_STECR|nr:hypothetical protein L596_013645 [Steinernema carpocapsae]
MSLDHVPSDLFVDIGKHIDFPTLLRMREVDHRTKALADKTLRDLKLFPVTINMREDHEIITKCFSQKELARSNAADLGQKLENGSYIPSFAVVGKLELGAYDFAEDTREQISEERMADALKILGVPSANKLDCVDLSCGYLHFPERFLAILKALEKKPLESFHLEWRNEGLQTENDFSREVGALQTVLEAQRGRHMEINLKGPFSVAEVFDFAARADVLHTIATLSDEGRIALGDQNAIVDFVQKLRANPLTCEVILQPQRGLPRTGWHAVFDVLRTKFAFFDVEKMRFNEELNFMEDAVIPTFVEEVKKDGASWALELILDADDFTCSCKPFEGSFWYQKDDVFGSEFGEMIDDLGLLDDYDAPDYAEYDEVDYDDFEDGFDDDDDDAY